MEKILIIGCGNRALEMFILPFVKTNNEFEITAICDTNIKRMEYVASLIPYHVKCYLELADIENISSFNYCIVTTRDCHHTDIILKISSLGVKVICEKPIATSVEQVKRLLSVPNISNNIKIAYNSRYMPINKAIKKCLSFNKIGKIKLVNYNWYINESHGIEYFRRWHRKKSESGGMLVHKSCHHFDLVNWWLEDYPIEVQATMKLTEFGSDEIENKICRTCDNVCRYRMTKKRRLEFENLYFQCEEYDRYYRDSCVYDKEVDISDVMCVSVKYKQGTLLNYSLNMLSVETRWDLVLVGTLGEIRVHYREFNDINIIVCQSNGKVENYEISKIGVKHEGADKELREYLFQNSRQCDLDMQTGIDSAVIGILANISAERNERIRVEEYIEDWNGKSRINR